MIKENEEVGKDWRTYSEHLDNAEFPGLPPGMVTETPPTTTALIQVNPNGNSKIAKLHQEALALLSDAERLVITEPRDLKGATDSLAMIKGLKTALEDARTGYTRPINDHLKDVNTAFKLFTDPLNQADAITRNKVLAFRTEEEVKRKEQERINALREEAARSEMALTGELSEPVALAEVTPALHRSSMTNMGSAGTRITWKWEVEDLSKVPMEYLMIDASKVGKVVRAGLHSIPGIRIWDEQGLAVSVNKG